jgi:peptidoglycan hydrolase-like protein with peptidoglycan-binding domain
MKNLDKEILRQLSLISYDRSLILSEQKNNTPLVVSEQITKKVATSSDRLGPKGQFQPYEPIKRYNDFKASWRLLTPEKKAQVIYDTIKNEINKPETDEQLILNYLKLLTPETYEILLNKVKKIKGFKTRETYFNKEGDINTVTRNFESVIEWIQQNEFSAGELGHDENKKWLNQYVSILSKFGDYSEDMWDSFNSFEEQQGSSAVDGGDNIGTYEGKELTAKEWAQALHIFLPLGSIIISIMAPPTWFALGAAALLELGDAALYATVDKDPYVAGFSAICAFIPFGQMAFMPAVTKLGKNGLKKLLQKIIQKEGSFIDDEIKAVKELYQNYSKLEKLAKLNMVKKLTLLSIRSIKSVSKLIKFLGKLINRGLLNHESLGQSGLWIAGSFITWDKIAKINGICNTMPLSALKQADWKILKKIGYAGEYLQPYSDPCDLQKGVELLEKYNATNIIEEILKQDIENNVVYSLDYSDVKTLSVELIQKVLIAGGFNKNLSSENPTWSYMFNKINVSNAKEIKKITIYNKKGIFVKKFENIPQKSSINFDVSGLQKGDYNIVFENNDGTKYESKFTYGGQSLNTPIKIKRPTDMEIGYYDEATYLSVKKYQKSKGLTDDGLAGKNTIESILSDFKNHKYGLSVNKLNEMNLDEMRIKKIQKEFEEWSSDVETKFLSGQYSIEKVQDAYDKDKKRNEELGNLIYNSMEKTEAENADEEDLEVVSEPFNENN